MYFLWKKDLKRYYITFYDSINKVLGNYVLPNNITYRPIWYRIFLFNHKIIQRTKLQFSFNGDEAWWIRIQWISLYQQQTSALANYWNKCKITLQLNMNPTSNCKILTGFCHPPYSHELVSSDYHLFLHLRMWLASQYFHNDELQISILGWLQSLAGEFYDCRIHTFIKQYDKYLNLARNCVEKWMKDCSFQLL